MFVTYQRDGETEKQEWEFDPNKVRQAQAELIEKRFGGTWDMFRIGVQQGNSRARRVLLWHLLCRDHHTLRYEDTPDFMMGELLVEHGVAELEVFIARAEKLDLDDDERDQVVASLRLELAEARERAGLPPEPDVIDGELADDDQADAGDHGPGKASLPNG